MKERSGLIVAAWLLGLGVGLVVWHWGDWKLASGVSILVSFMVTLVFAWMDKGGE